MCIGKALKERRVHCGLSMQEVAKKLNTTDSRISNLENGKTKKVEIDFVCQVANALGWDPIDLLRAAGYISQSDMQRHEMQIFRHTENLAAVDLEYIQRFVDACAEQVSDNGVK